MNKPFYLHHIWSVPIRSLSQQHTDKARQEESPTAQSSKASERPVLAICKRGQIFSIWIVRPWPGLPCFIVPDREKILDEDQSLDKAPKRHVSQGCPIRRAIRPR